MHWLKEQVLRAARELEKEGNTIRAFRAAIEDRLHESPVTDWESLFWTRGVKRGLIHLNNHWFRLGSGRQTSFSFFVRNEAGLLVGLRRESIAQAAVYAALVTHYGYPRSRVRFEIDYLDVALRDDAGQVVLYAETKASDRVLDRLVKELENYREGLPFLELPEGVAPPDAFQKASHILRHRPAYFWGVSPNRRAAFQVEYADAGFSLKPAKDIPFNRDVELLPAAM